jgi:hypothetical protein
MKITTVGGGGGAASNSFAIIQPITGTSPAADSSTDTLTLESSDSSIGIAGDSALDKIDFSVGNHSAAKITSGTLPEARGGTNHSTYATGDILYASASNTLSKLSAPSARKNQVLKCNTGGSPSWRDVLEPSKFVDITEHFMGYTGPLQVAFNSSGPAYSGIDATASVPDGNHPGIVKVTLNAATDYLVVSPTTGGAVSMAFGVGYAIHECWFYLGQLSDATNTFTIRSGFGNVITGAAVTDGAYMSYTHGSNSGQWQLITTSNSVSTTTNTATGVATGWNKCTVACNADGTSVEFFINGTSLGTNTTNIPLAYARRTQPFWSFAQTVGTGNVYCVLDYWHYYQELP